MANDETSCWNIDDALPVAPSILYPLTPLGVGTPFVESLTSFVKRLAQAHHIKVVDLVTFCGTQTEADILPSTLQKLSRIDGITTGARSWPVLLRDLTCQDEVVCLTMDYWRSLLNPYRILRQYHAWCPKCYADAVQTESPLYEPLLWRLRCVEVCPVHFCRLMDICPTCGCRFTTLSNRAVVGFCPKCHHWLGSSSTTDENISVSEEASQIAQAVGHLLSLAPRVKPPEWKQLCTVISVVKQHQQTTYTQFERILHFGMTSLMDVKAGLRQPNLEVLARLSMFSGEVLWEALVQSTVPPLPHSLLERSQMNTLNEKRLYLEYLLASTEPLPGLAYIAHQCGFPTVWALRKVFPDIHDILWQRIHEEQRQSLEEALQQAVPVVLSEWAFQHGYSTGDLYHHFYELCCQITSRFQADKETRCHHYLQQLLQREQTPFLAAICKTLGVGEYYLKRHFAEELQCLEARRWQSLQQDEVTARDYFKQLLESEDNASVSLQQVAEALGKSVKYLKHTFPVESRLLMDRRRAYIAAQVDMTCQRIHQLVFDLHQQGIYPSVDRIHAAISSWMVHGKAYRRAYIDAMTRCGYSPSSLK